MEPDDSETTVKLLDRNAVALGGFVGVDVSDSLSGELYYNDLGNAELTIPDGLDYQVAGISGLYYVSPYSENIGTKEGVSFYGRAGAGKLYNQSSASVVKDNSFYMLFGIGLEYGWSSGLALRTEIVSYDKDANYAGLSLLYRTAQNDQNIEVASSSPMPEPAEPFPFEADKKPIDKAAQKPQKTPSTTEKFDLSAERYALQSMSVLFDHNSSYLNRSAVRKLAAIANVLLADKRIFIDVRAYADVQGTRQYNLWMSERRGRRIANMLRQFGVSWDRMMVYAHEETQKFDGSMSKKGLSANRRGDIMLYRLLK